MRIIIEAESKNEQQLIEGKKQIHEHVQDFFVSGTKVTDGLLPQQFHTHHGSFEWILGMLHYWLKKIEKALDQEG